MSSRYRSASASAIWLVAAMLLGCQREERAYNAEGAASNGPAATPLVTLSPGTSIPKAPDPRGAEFQSNAYHINQGARLYQWFNCSGCHAAGGGDIGPALMDDEWRYGGSIDNIYSSIIQGRPNGMPSFQGKITDLEAWQLAAYVRALGGNVPKDAAPSRRDSMTATPPLTQLPSQPPKNADAAGNQEPQK